MSSSHHNVLDNVFLLLSSLLSQDMIYCQRGVHQHESEDKASALFYELFAAAAPRRSQRLLPLLAAVVVVT